MGPSIPVATDNIYKFYALSGLVILVSCLLGFFYLHKAQIELQSQLVTEVQTLKANSNRTKEEDVRLAVLIQRQTVERDDFQFTLKALSFVIGGVLVVMGFGFWQWHYKIQPQQDRLTRLQVEKLNLEIEKAALEVKRLRRPTRH